MLFGELKQVNGAQKTTAEPEVLTVRSCIRWGTERLTATSPTAQTDARILMESVLQLDATQLFLAATKAVSPTQWATYQALVQRRSAHEPIAYIIGEKGFMGLDFVVGPGVLIPRPDTEVLVEAVLAQTALPDHMPIRVLDLCTGSGAIIIGILAFRPLWQGVGVELSLVALEVARENSRRLLGESAEGNISEGTDQGMEQATDQLTDQSTEQPSAQSMGQPTEQPSDPPAAQSSAQLTDRPTDRLLDQLSVQPSAQSSDRPEATQPHQRLQLIQGDIFQPERLEMGLFDVVVSNPPYIPTQVIAGLEATVVDYEPYLALNGGPDGLDYYRKIVLDRVKYLKPSGRLYFEVGHDQSTAVLALMQEAGFVYTESYKDLQGFVRVVGGQWLG